MHNLLFEYRYIRFSGLLKTLIPYWLLILSLMTWYGRLFADPNDLSLEEILKKIVHDKESSGGRKPGSADHAEVKNYLIQSLKSLHFSPGGDHKESGRSWVQAFTAQTDDTPGGDLDAGVLGQNIIGLFTPKNSPTKNPALILSAHYDHLGTNCHFKRFPKDRPHICPGASDNAGGVAAILLSIKNMVKTIHVPFAVVFFDLEEFGLQGSEYFAKRPSFPLSQVSLAINLDIIGANIFPGFSDQTLLIGAETGGNKLINLIKSVEPTTRLKQNFLCYAFGHNRNDTTSYINHLKNRFPTVFISDGDGGVYHSGYDNLDYLSYDKVERVSELVTNLSLQLAALPKKINFSKPKKFPGGAYLPCKSDAKTIGSIFEDLLQKKGKYKFTDDELQRLGEYRSDLEGITEQFIPLIEPAKMRKVAEAAEYLIGLSRSYFIRNHQDYLLTNR